MAVIIKIHIRVPQKARNKTKQDITPGYELKGLFTFYISLQRCFSI